MKSKKATTDSTGHWALDAHSHQTWRIAHQKNQDRDFRKFACAAFLEETVVKNYRKKLFHASTVAKYLRTSLRTTLAPFVKPYNVISKGKKTVTAVQLYVFPDNQKNTTQTTPPDIDIDDMVDSSDKIAYIKKGCKGIKSLKKSILNHPSTKLFPGSSKTNRAVADCIASLERVRPSSFFILIPRSFILTGTPQKYIRLAKNGC